MAEYFSFIDPEQLQKTLNPALKDNTPTDGEEPVSKEADDQTPEPETEL